MKPRDRKLAILRQLSQESEPISLSELMGKLTLDFTDRTVRRWLSELIQEGFVEKSGHTKNVKYIAVKNKIPSNGEISSCFSSESLEAIEKVKRPLFERTPVAYNSKWLESYKPNKSFYLPNHLKKELGSSGQRAHENDPAGTYAHQIFNRLLIDIAFNSSRLEGNTYSFLETEKLLLHGDTPEGKLDEEKVMILNHKEAIRYLVENATKIDVSENVIYTIHYLLADGLLEPNYCGKVRDHGVRIGGSVYMPFEDVSRLQKHVQIIAKKCSQIENPYEQSLFLLAHMSYIQAFSDVNKRTARVCANIPLITKNLVPLSFNDVKIEDYMSAMISIYEFQDMRPLIDLYAYSYLRTAAAYESTVKSMGFDEVRVRFRKQRREVIREIITQNISSKKLEAFIIEKAEKLLPEIYQNDFIQDIREDLEQMDESRLAGLGVTINELSTWQTNTKRHK